MKNDNHFRRNRGSLAMFLKISAVYSAQENDVLHNKTCGKSDTGHVFFTVLSNRDLKIVGLISTNI